MGLAGGCQTCQWESQGRQTLPAVPPGVARGREGSGNTQPPPSGKDGRGGVGSLRDPSLGVWQAEIFS